MSPEIYLTTLGLFFGLILLIFGMKYGSAAYQARARLAGDTAYRDLAQKAVTGQSEGATILSSVRADMADVRTRLAAIETMLKDVG